MRRGKFLFEVDENRDPLDTANNVEALRQMWLDRALIAGEDLGPGNDGDFDNGAWHSACHLAAAAGVIRAADGRLAWLQIEHDPRADDYYAGVTVKQGDRVVTVRLGSADGRALTDGAKVLGFVEGTSVGRTSAREVSDSPQLFNRWRRQDFDRRPTSRSDGGRVWEHWCTLRDIRPSHRIGTSMLTAYVALVAALGDRFAPTVARGRRDYGHPIQLAAMVASGLTSEEAATWDTKPLEIPAAAAAPLNESESPRSLGVAAELPWPGDEPVYYMFARKIGSFSEADKVREDLANF